MLLYHMIFTSVQNFKCICTDQLVGDTYAIVRNVVKYGAPNSVRMKKKLVNYECSYLCVRVSLLLYLIPAISLILVYNSIGYEPD